jgi:hypothetical protein
VLSQLCPNKMPSLSNQRAAKAVFLAALGVVTLAALAQTSPVEVGILPSEKMRRLSLHQRCCLLVCSLHRRCCLCSTGQSLHSRGCLLTP